MSPISVFRTFNLNFFWISFSYRVPDKAGAASNLPFRFDLFLILYFFSSLSCCCCQKLNLDLLLNSSSYPLHNHKRFIPNHQNYLPHFNTGSQDFLGFHEFLWPEYDEFPSLSSLWRTSKNHRYHSWMEAITFHLSQGSGQHLVSISLLVSLWYPQLVCSLLTYLKYRFLTWLCVCVLCRQSVPTLFACCSPTIVRTSWLVALVPSSPCVPSSMSGTEER